MEFALFELCLFLGVDGFYGTGCYVGSADKHAIYTRVKSLNDNRDADATWMEIKWALSWCLCFVCSQYYIEFQSQMCRGAWRALFTDISTIFNSLKSFSWNSIFKRKWCYNHKLYLTDPMLLIIFTGFNYLNFDKSLANVNNNMRRWFTKPVLKQLHLNGQKY